MSVRANGTGDFLTVAASLGLSTGPFSMAGWVYAVSLRAAYSNLLALVDALGGPTDYIILNLDPSNLWDLASTTGGVSLTGSPSTATWYYLVVDRSGTTMRVRLFDDTSSTTPVNSNTFTDGRDYSALDNFVIGDVGAGEWPDCEFACARVHIGVSWTDAQCRTESQKLTPQTGGGTIYGNWKLETVTADSDGINDSGGGAHHLTNTGFVNGASRPSQLEAAANPSAAITGTATASITEADIVAGGKTIIITLTDDTWVAVGGTFDAVRQDIIDGIDSAQAEGTGWDAEVKAKQGVAGVVRTSDTVVTVTLDAQAAYNTTAQETITVTVPISASVTAVAPIVASPTFTVAAVGTYDPPVLPFLYLQFKPPGAQGGGGGSPTSALQFAGNINHPSASPSVRLVWPAPMAGFPATYIMRVYPKDQDGYWAGLFWADDMTVWDDGVQMYYGMHPYPNPPQTGPPTWEISIDGGDFLDAAVAFGTWPPTAPTGAGWYTHVMRISAGGVARFHVDWPNATPLIQHADTVRTLPAAPIITIGDAPWNPGMECYGGLHRGYQFYDAELSDADVNAERATPGSARTPWYLNLNPTPDDITDKSGNGHHPVWVGANRPTLWQPG